MEVLAEELKDELVADELDGLALDGTLLDDWTDEELLAEEPAMEELALEEMLIDGSMDGELITDELGFGYLSILELVRATLLDGLSFVDAFMDEGPK